MNFTTKLVKTISIIVQKILYKYKYINLNHVNRKKKKNHAVWCDDLLPSSNSVLRIFYLRDNYNLFTVYGRTLLTKLVVNYLLLLIIRYLTPLTDDVSRFVIWFQIWIKKYSNLSTELSTMYILMHVSNALFRYDVRISEIFFRLQFKLYRNFCQFLKVILKFVNKFW